MAKCEFCKKEMLEVGTCSYAEQHRILYPDGLTLLAEKDQFPVQGDRCHDCDFTGYYAKNYLLADSKQ